MMKPVQPLKFAEIGNRYFEQRRRFSEENGPRELWSVIDHWSLYVGIGNLARSMAIQDLLRRTLEVPGHIAEFGSWRGANLMLLAKTLRICDPMGSKQVFCFDSFEGLTEFAPEDGDEATQTAGKYKGSLEELKNLISLYELGDEVIICQGNIENTLPSMVESRKELSFSFIYIDVDLYEATKVILNQTHDRLSSGGLIVFDEWNRPKYPGETLAAREFLESHGDAYTVEHVRNTNQPNLVLCKK